MMVPTTMAVACETFRSRARSRRSPVADIAAVSGMSLAFTGRMVVAHHQAYKISDCKGHSRADQHVPRKGNLSELPDVEVQRESAKQPHHGSGLIRSFRQ